MNRKGFTLIELLAVMTIMMVLSGITIVAYRGFIGSTTMNSAVTQMRQTLQLARQTAIVNGRDVYVVFWQDPASRSNWYTTCMLQGYVTCLDGNTFIDMYNPQLITTITTNSEVFNLRPEIGSVGQVVYTQLTNWPIDNYVISNLCIVRTTGVLWSEADKYGLEVRRRMRLPRGFLFTQSPPKSIRFRPTGEAEGVGTPLGLTWSVIFYEVAKPENVGTVSVDPFGFVRVQFAY